MAIYQQWWFILTIIAIIIFLLTALIYFFWVDPNKPVPWWVTGGVVISLILIIAAFVVYIIERSRIKEKQTKWMCTPVCQPIPQDMKVKIENAMIPPVDSLYPSGFNH